MKAKIIYNKVAQVLKSRKHSVLFSLCNVFFLLLISYLVNNQPLFTGENLNQYAWMELLKNKLGLSEDENTKDALFINVSYDKQLVDKFNEYGLSSGNSVVTDRSKLLAFLKLLHKSNSYKYIILDIRFENGYDVPEVDSALFAEILDMRDIVIADHSNIELADNRLKKKAALSDYNATIVETNFTRYRYKYDSLESVPLFAYHDITKNSIDKFGWLYFCNHKLCYNSLFVHFPVDDWNEFDEQQNKVYYNLGSDILDNYTDADIKEFAKNKYVIIGDMVEDIHDTYSGVKPGPVITYFSFQELMKGHHFVNWCLVFFLSIIYFFISVSLFEKKSFMSNIPFVKKSYSRLFHFIMNFAGYTLILSLTMFVLYVILGIATSILIPSTFFAIQKTIISYKRSKI